MGIYKIIRDKEISFSLQQSSKSNSFIYFDLNEALSHISIILEGLKCTETQMKSVENLLDFFVVRRISLFSSIVDSIKDAKQQGELRKLLDAAVEVEKAFSVGAAIKLINSDYRQLFDRKKDAGEKRDLFFPLVEFCTQYPAGINDDVFKFLAEEHSFVYITYYEELKKKLISTPLLYENVFTEEKTKNLIRSKCQILLEIAKSISETKQKGQNCYALLNRHIFLASMEIMTVVTDRELLVYGDSMRRVRRYFSEIDYDQKELSKFEDAYKTFDEKLCDYLDHHGSVFSHEIPGDIAAKIMESDVEWIAKQLPMTHTLKGGKLASQFSYDGDDGPSLVDMVSHNIDVDEYFTYSRQQKVQISASVGTALIMQIYCNQQYREECITWIAALLDAVMNVCNLAENGIVTDLLAIDQSLEFVEVARKTKGSEHCWSLVYGASMLIIASIEKLLRIIYKFEKNVVLSDELIQLGPLLNNETIEHILTEDLMNGVGFFLSKYGYIGLNYRNRLAHLSEIKIDEIPRALPYTFFYLYTCVVNGTFAYYCASRAEDNA